MTTRMMPICCLCTRLHRGEDGLGLIPMRCDAYPDGIPTEILYSQADHREAYEGDGGIQFEPRDQMAVAYANVLFPRRAPRRASEVAP